MGSAAITDMEDVGTLDGEELVELSRQSPTVRITATTISADGDDQSFNDSANGFVAAGFAVGHRIGVLGFTGDAGNNLFVGIVTALTTAKMTIGGDDGAAIVDDAAGESVTIFKWETRRGSMSAVATLVSTLLGSAALLDADTDGTAAANSDLRVATQKAMRSYIDAKLNGLAWKLPVRAATTTNAALATAYENGDTIDGVVLATGDRILIKDQTTQTENGIYVVAASGAPARATDADSGAELLNAVCFVQEGTANGDKSFTQTTNAPITVGSSNLVWAQQGSGGSGITDAPSDGTEYVRKDGAWAHPAVAADNKYRVPFNFASPTPTADEVLLTHVFTDAVDFADDWAGAYAKVGTNPAATFAMVVKKNGTTVGSISVSTSGVVTFATTGTTVSFAAGDALTVLAPTTPDTTIVNFAATFRGTLA